MLANSNIDSNIDVINRGIQEKNEGNKNIFKANFYLII